jgi:predicted RNA-binding Zn-ribbon protein involved in translation (DUF1610 family)
VPLFRFRCASCGVAQQRILAPEHAATPGACPSCGGVLEREASGATASVVERIDTGVSIRATERLADAPRLHRERQLAATRKQ